MAISAVMSAQSQKKEGQAQEAAANFQADQQDTQAAQTQAMGYQQAKRIREQGTSNIGQANAALASSGVDVGTGTSNDIRQKITQNTETDALNSILNADNRATSLRQQATMTRMAGANAAEAGNTNALTSLLRGGSQMMGGWKTATQ
ncbi:hypothetical protein WJ04_09165 [Burkholderia vietnamiensis]|nr:hypothetical protein WJ04_09165 [Burkholderia vietnamiensis]